MGKMYQLDLRTLLDSLSQQTATLRAELRKGLSTIREPCTGYVSLEGGRIVQCVIVGKNGVLKEGNVALELLQSVVEWHVELQRDSIDKLTFEPPDGLSDFIPVSPPGPQSSPFLKPISTGSYDDMVPRQCMSFPVERSQTLTAKDRLTLRTVLVMIDGQRSIRQIKESLQLSPQTIEQVLEYLLQLQIIEM